MTTTAIAATEIEGLKLLARGKVRDIYEVDDEHLFIVATDRISAFDFVLDPPIPDKGRVLTALTVFWIRYLEMLEEESLGVRNHLVAWHPEQWPEAVKKRTDLVGRAMLVRRAPCLPVECIVRGYMAGSVFKGYQKNGKVAGFYDAPEGMVLGGKFPQPMFTPTTKAEQGEHDENLPYEKVVELIGEERAEAIRKLSIRIYELAAGLAAKRGVILCDTKFEFGLTKSNELFLIDEVLTPDSSRYWRKELWKEPGCVPPAMDKQVVRDQLEASGWKKTPPPPRLSEDTVAKTRAAYRDIYKVLTGYELSDDPEQAMLDADRAGTEAAGQKLIGE